MSLTMKLSTLAVLVWTAPSAAGSPSNRPDPCEELGADEAENLWWEMGGSCSNIWTFGDTVDRYLYENYPTDTSDWRTNSCNALVAKGAEQVVDEYEKQCLIDPECYDLGRAAAQMIAFDFCPSSSTDSTSYGSPNYDRFCRFDAYGICEDEST